MGAKQQLVAVKHRVVRSAAYTGLSGKYRRCPENCGELEWPGASVKDWMVDYAEVTTTADQLRIEEVLEGLVDDVDAVLHIGVGNSGLAERFAGRVARIDGATVSDHELERARSLALDGYRVELANKYAWSFRTQFEQGYDVIVDNNLTSFACCRHHVYVMLDAYAALLRPGGRILTDRGGMAWTVSNPRWSITEADLRRLGEPYGFAVTAVTDHVFSLTRAG